MKFIETLKNVWKITELKDRIILTLGLLLVYRFGAQVVLPGIDATQLGSLASNTDSGLLGLLNAFTGGAFAKASVFALGIMPYISASIVVQLMGIAIPYLQKLQKEGGNLNLTISSSITTELKIDQSIAHNGVCLTIVDIDNEKYTVTAIQETLDKTNLGILDKGDKVNLERAMKLGDRLDGHIVQGHVDQTGTCISVIEENGSWIYTFEYGSEKDNITIEKGSITINGVSLTVVNSKLNEFSVAIIPYTYEHTTFHSIKEGDKVNLEFDVIGKYIKRLNELRN